MANKDSQLDEIERLAILASRYPQGLQFLAAIDPKHWKPGGVYYEMRRHNKRMDETLLSYEARITNVMRENEDLRKKLNETETRT